MPVARTPGRSPMAAGAREKRCLRLRAPSAACGGFHMPQLIDKDTGSTHVFLGPTRVPRVPKGFGAEVVGGWLSTYSPPPTPPWGTGWFPFPVPGVKASYTKAFTGWSCPFPKPPLPWSPPRPTPAAVGTARCLGLSPGSASETLHQEVRSQSSNPALSRK